MYTMWIEPPACINLGVPMLNDNTPGCVAAPGFRSETDFWDRELSHRGVYAEGIRNRLDPVLDLGSGLLSMLARGAHQRRYLLPSADPTTGVKVCIRIVYRRPA